MGKPIICTGRNKGADQLRGNREADQRLWFRYLNPKFQATVHGSHPGAIQIYKKVVHFFKIAKSCQTMTLVQTTNKIFEKRNQHLSIPSYCDQSEIYREMMCISRLTQTLYRKCQFHLFDN